MPASDYSGLYQSAGKQYGIDPALLQAVTTVESDGNPNAVSPQGARGPMQFMPATAQSMGVTDPTDPKQAIPAAAKLLIANAKQFGGPEGAILAYHGGTDQKNWGPKTQAYLAKVTQTYQNLKNGSSMASPSPSQPSQDAFSAAFGAGDSGTKAQPTSSPAVSSGPDPFSVAFGGSGSGVAASPTPAKTAPGMLQSLNAGIIQGARNVISSVDPIQQWVDKKIGPITLGGLLPTGDQAHAYNTTARNQFNQAYGNSTPAQIGQIGGEVGASLPFMAAGGEVLGPAIGAATKVVPGIAPVANFLTGASKGNRLLSLASKGAAGALQGTAATALTSGGSDQPIGQQLKQGAEFGGVLGAGTPMLSDMGASAYNKLTGGGVSPLRAALADKAVNQFGIPLRGSQISNSPFAKYLDSSVGKIPFSGMEGQNEAQRTAFTRAVASTMGASADNLTPEVMSSVRTSLGNNYNQIASRTSIPVEDLKGPLQSVIDHASQVLPDGDLKPLQIQVDRIIGTADQGSNAISGASYKALTAQGSPLDRATQSKDPNIRYYASQIERTLNSALTANASPEDAALLSQTNRQWKNMRTVQDLAAKAGIEGEISPSLLLGAVKKSYKDMPYSGAGDIGDLAHIGQQFLREPPSSGTGERLMLYRMLEGGAGGVAGVMGLEHPDQILHGAALGAGILGTGRIVGSALKSKAYRDMILNSAMNNHGATNALFGTGAGIKSAIGSGLKSYALPSSVIGGNQLLFNQPPVTSPP